jgi:hypothetical protein
VRQDGRAVLRRRHLHGAAQHVPHHAVRGLRWGRSALLSGVWSWWWWGLLHDGARVRRQRHVRPVRDERSAVLPGRHVHLGHVRQRSLRLTVVNEGGAPAGGETIQAREAPIQARRRHAAETNGAVPPP